MLRSVLQPRQLAKPARSAMVRKSVNSNLVASFNTCAVVNNHTKSQQPISSSRLLTPSVATSCPLPFQQTRAQANVVADTQPDMFCFQCEQTQDGVGCSTIGVCGKTPEVAKMQDLVLHQCKLIAQYMDRAYKMGAAANQKIDHHIHDAMFSTVTNVNFDATRFVEYLEAGQVCLAEAKQLYESTCQQNNVTAEVLPGASFSLASSESSDLAQQGEAYGVLGRKQRLGDDYVGLQELIMYGLKGAVAYEHGAEVYGENGVTPGFNQFQVECLNFLTREDASIEELLGMALKVGEQNLNVMGQLNNAAVSSFGHPEPTQFRTTAVKGKCILVSGHDLQDLEMILKQTEGKGINVYTHGELLPAHGYPGLKKYPHLVGNYGGAWQLQKFEFATFPGAIVVTTNCIIEPGKRYKNRIFTRHSVGWPGVQHIKDNDFTPVIECALNEPGFSEDEPEKKIMTGFGHNAVLGVAPQVIDAVKTGAISEFLLVGGCDGTEGERTFFKDVAVNAPKDAVILTLACGKYRFNKLDFGDIGGIPRLLDIGQCNDAYSAVQIAVALAKAFETDVNSLPLKFYISWFEQKAVAVLLSLLHLGIQNIRLGPNLPAFATPTMLSVLQDKFNLKSVRDEYTKQY